MNSDAPSSSPMENPCGGDQGCDRDPQCQEEPLEDLPDQPITADSRLLRSAASPLTCDKDASQEPNYRKEDRPAQQIRPVHVSSRCLPVADLYEPLLDCLYPESS